MNILYYAIVAIHVIVCIVLVLVVLLQSGKGADLAGAFGGGATQTAFGSRGPASFLSKMTTISAIVFMLTSIGLSIPKWSHAPASKSILENKKQTTTAPPAKKEPAVKAPARETQEDIQRRLEELQKKRQSEPAPVDSSKQPEKK